MRKILVTLLTVIGVVTAVQLLAVPDTFNFQGKLYTPPNSGTPVADSTTNTVYVAIYATPTAGTALWTTTLYNVKTRNGLFSIDISGFGPSLDFTKDYWLGLRFNSDPQELSPRQQLLPSAYAGRSQFVNQVDSTTKIFGPVNITSTSATESGLSVTSTGTSAILGLYNGVTGGAGVVGYNMSTYPYSAGVYGFANAGMAVYGEATGTAGVAVQGENKNGGMGGYFKGLTGVAATSDTGGIGLYAYSPGGAPLYAEGGVSTIKQGLVVDSMAMPAGLWVSFTAGAWPAMMITAPNGQALVVQGGSSGLGKPVVEIRAGDFASNYTGLSVMGKGDGFNPAYGVSATAQGGTGVMGIGVTGVAAVSTDYWNGLGLDVYGRSLFDGGVSITATGGADPMKPALYAANDAGTSQAVLGINNPGTAVKGIGSTGVSGQGVNVGTEGIAANNSGTGVLARNEQATGSDGGAALYIAGKIKASGGLVAGSPVGSATVPTGDDPFIMVTNNLASGTYRVVASPSGPITCGGGQARCTWYVEKQAGYFNIHIITEGTMAVDNAVPFDYIIINE